MLRDEAHQVGRCLQFLEVDACPAAVETCIQAGSFKDRSGGRERGQEDPKNFYRRGIAGDWPNHLTPEQAATFCAPVAPLMRSCGYDPVEGLEMGARVSAAAVRHAGARTEAA
jgi:hypothetical protein